MAPRKRSAKQANLDEEYRLSISESVPASPAKNEPYALRKRPRMPVPKTNTKNVAENTAKIAAKDPRSLVRKSTTTGGGKSEAAARSVAATAAARPQGIRKSERTRKPPQVYEALSREEERAERERLAAETALKRKKLTAKQTVKQSTKQTARQTAKHPAKRPIKQPAKQPTKQPAKQIRKQPTKQPTKRPTQEPTCDYCEEMNRRCIISSDGCNWCTRDEMICSVTDQSTGEVIYYGETGFTGSDSDYDNGSEAAMTDVIMVVSDSEHEPQGDDGHAPNPPQAELAILQQQIAQLQQTNQHLTTQNQAFQVLQVEYDDLYVQHEALVLSYGALEATQNTETLDQDMANRSQDLQAQFRDQAFQNQYQKALSAHQNLIASYQKLQTQYNALKDTNESLRRQLSRYSSFLPTQPDDQPPTGQEERGVSPWRVEMEEFIDFSQAGPNSKLHDPNTMLFAEHDPANQPTRSIEDVAGQTPLEAQEQQLVDRAFREGCLDPMVSDGAMAPSPDDQSMTDTLDFT